MISTINGGITPYNLLSNVPSTSPLSSPTIAEGKLLLPYPAYGNVQYANQGMGDSSYNSLQRSSRAVSVRRRVTGGIHVFEAYRRLGKPYPLA